MNQSVRAMNTAMPPSGAAWSFLRNRRNMLLACGISAFVHVFAYWSAPAFVTAWHEPPVARYNAVLLAPLAGKEESLNSLGKDIPAKPQRRSANAARRAPPAAIVAGNETGRVAPENAAATTVIEPVPEPVAQAILDSPPGESATKVEPLASAPIAQIAPETLPAEESPPELPASISIAYRMTSSVSDGVADYSWKRDGSQYEIDSTMQATGFIVGSLVGALHQVSRGEISPSGLMPASFSIRRGEGEAETADFARSTNEMKLVRKGKTQLVPMPARIQDMQSFLFQLAYDAPRLKSPDERLEVMVTNARKVYRHRFRQVGVETVQTRAGPVETLHLLSEAVDPEDAYEVWLATKNYHLPVKIKFFAGRFPIELIATSIRSTP
jgi:Protein of unknown function (DUF3108)